MKFRSFMEKDKKEIIEVMGNTWNFHKEFTLNKGKHYIYEFFLDLILYDSNYAQVAVDSNDNFLGCIFGKLPEKLTLNSVFNKIKKTTKLSLKFLKYFHLNYLGKKKRTLKTLYNFTKELAPITDAEKNYESSVQLFIVSEKARGQGLGKKLMNNFIDVCKKKNIKNTYLLTDRGCTYQFYDKYGFEKIVDIHSNMLAEPQYKTNGFGYVYHIKK